MLSKAHLTSHSKMSGSRWVITSSWLSGLWRSFLYSSSVYSCHLFLLSSASVSYIPFLSFIEPIFAWNVPLVSLIFLTRSLVFYSVLFLYFFALIAEEGFLSLLAILWNSAFRCLYLSFSPWLSLLFFSQLFVRLPQTAILLFCISFPWGWSWSLSWKAKTFSLTLWSLVRGKGLETAFNHVAGDLIKQVINVQIKLWKQRGSWSFWVVGTSVCWEGGMLGEGR